MRYRMVCKRPQTIMQHPAKHEQLLKNNLNSRINVYIYQSLGV